MSQHATCQPCKAQHLDKKLSLDPPRGFVLARCSPGGAQRIDLIKKDHRGRALSCKVEESPHHALRLPPAHLLAVWSCLRCS